MKLLAYIIDDNGTPKPINEIARGYSLNELNENEPFKIIDDNENVGLDYQNISSIENWDKFGKALIGTAFGFKDWKCLRNEIKLLAESKAPNGIDIDFNNFSDVEKPILIQYLTNIISQHNKTLVVGDDDLLDKISIGFDINSMKAREQRYMVARTYLIKKIGKLNAIEFSTDCTIPKFEIKKGNYVTMFLGGVETKAENGVLALIDMIKGNEVEHNETAVEQLKALIHRSYPIIDGTTDTIEIVSQNLENILLKGLY